VQFSGRASDLHVEVPHSIPSTTKRGKRKERERRKEGRKEGHFCHTQKIVTLSCTCTYFFHVCISAVIHTLFGFFVVVF
jgi:hypothetical protein